MVNKKSFLEEMRLSYKPPLPPLLSDISHISFESFATLPTLPAIKAVFPHATQHSVLQAKLDKPFASSILRVGIVFSGGQAAGGHNVVAGLFDALAQLNSKNVLIGFLDGPRGIVQGNHISLTSSHINSYRNLGGFDLLGSGRTKIETEEQLKSSLSVMQKLQLDGLVVVGGDDSNTNSAVLAEYFLKNGCTTHVIGVPKTIDGDLSNAYVSISFGFDTATKTYAELIGNLAKDTLSDKRYYHFIKLMGRSASHIALECALSTQPNLTFIAEEKKSLPEIVSELADLVIQRASLGKHFGIVLIPEGLIEFIPEMQTLLQELSHKSPSQLSPPMEALWTSFPEIIQKQLLLGRDSHGNLSVSAIQTDILLIEMTKQELKKRNFHAPFTPVPHFFGYEGRSALPSNFDATYCQALGYTAALLIARGYTGYMSFVSHLNASPQEWSIGGVPLTPLMHFEMRSGVQKPVIAKTLVNLNAKPYSTYKKQKDRWKTEDAYLFPGPIQFFGEPSLTNTPPSSIK